MTPEPAHDDVMRGLLPLLDLFDELEQQAAGLELERRDAEVDDRVRDEYAEVDLASRLHASVGSSVGFGPARVRRRARHARPGGGGLVPAGGGRPGGVARAAGAPGSAGHGDRGLSERAVPAGARSVLSRLTLASCLRRLAESGERQVLRTTDGGLRSGEVGRVGADFVELWDDAGAVQVPLRALVWVRRG